MISVQPCTVSSALVPVSVSFEQILPLPKRERSTSKRTRPKPPAYELTGDATMQFVVDRTEPCKKKKKKLDVKKRKSVRENDTQTNRIGGARKTSIKKASTVDTVPCSVCKIRRCDDEYSRS